MRCCLLTGVLALALSGLCGEVPPEVAHRREAVTRIADPATYRQAIIDGLKDSDAFVRRYALYRLYAQDPERATKVSKRFLNDSSVGVRKLAKSMNRTGGLFRENVARSVDPLYDHDVNKVETVVPKDGVFEMKAPLPADCWAELWFGKPKEDLYVWLNGVYVGQFDVDSQLYSEFRLDVTKELKAPGTNEIVVQDANRKPIPRGCTVEVMK